MLVSATERGGYRFVERRSTLGFVDLEAFFAVHDARAAAAGPRS